MTDHHTAVAGLAVPGSSKILETTHPPDIHRIPSERLEEISRCLQADPLLQFCPGDSLARLLGRAYLRQLQPGELLQAIGHPATEAFLVVHGALSLPCESGETICIRAGLVGQEAVLDMDAYATTLEASESTEVVVFPRVALREIVWKNESLRKLVFASFSDRFTRCSQSDDVEHHHATSGQVYGPAFQRLAAARIRATTVHAPPLRELIGWIMALLLPLSTYLGLSLFADMPSVQAIHMVTIAVVAVVMWVFRLIPEFVPALFGVLVPILLGLSSPEIALSGFASDGFFMALGIFGLSSVLVSSGFSYRMLLWLLLLGPTNKIWYNFSLFTTGTLLTPVVPSANGRVSIVAPFLNDLASNFDAHTVRSEGPRLMSSVLTGTSLFSATFLSSKSINFVVFGFLPFQEQAQFNWFYWLFAASVVSLVMSGGSFFGLALLFWNDSSPRIPKSTVRQQVKMLGPMKAAEWAGVLGLILLLVGFLTASIHHIAIPWISLALIFGLLMFDFVQKHHFREDIDWAFLIFLGGLVGMVGVVRHLRIDVWLASQLDWLAEYMKHDFNTFIAILAGTIFVSRIALPINATVVIFATLLIPTATNIGVNAWLVGFLVLLFSESFVWPFQASYYVQLQGLLVKGIETESTRIILFNLFMSVVKVLAVYASLPFWHRLGIL